MQGNVLLSQLGAHHHEESAAADKDHGSEQVLAVGLAVGERILDDQGPQSDRDWEGESGNIVLPLQSIDFERKGHPQDDVVVQHFLQGEISGDELVRGGLQELFYVAQDLADRFGLLLFLVVGRVPDQEVDHRGGEQQHRREEIDVDIPPQF